MKTVRQLLLTACWMAGVLAGALQAQDFKDGYKILGYNQEAVDNPVARLAARLQSGEVELEYRGEHGYLESLLAELGIDPDSQVLVFSPTSLQYKLIGPETPRALYFNENTYIGWVLDSDIIEITTLDEKFGAVFYVFNNKPEPKEYFERSNQRCLVCHDSNGTMGGGVPLLMARSSIYSVEGLNLSEVSGMGNVGDQTPVSERWGGWYVTGEPGALQHLGNLRLSDPAQLERLDDVRVGNLPTLAGAGLFDTTPYLRPTSDVLALMIMEHQLTIQNMYTYVRFKSPAVLDRMGYADAIGTQRWAELPEPAQRVLTRMLDKLVRQLFLVDAAPLEAEVAGLESFKSWFLAQGPRDAAGRSLRELDLQQRLFRYPLSYLVYSADLETLPAFARDYVYRRIVAVLSGREQDPDFAHIDAEQRAEMLELLRETHPVLRGYIENGAPLASNGGLWH